MLINQWPMYDARTGLAQQDTPQPRYSRPDKPKQPWRPPHQRRGLREHALDALFTAALITIACGLLLLVLVALALGTRDLIRLALGSL